MICPNCGRTNPDDAHFCIYCATRLAPETPAVVETAPATGPTTRLGPMPAYEMPAPVPAPVAARPPMRRIRRHNHVAGAPIFLIGLGILLLTGRFWPGILVLIGVTTFINESARGRQQAALRGLIFFVGLTLLFWTGWFWPGILIVIALSTLMKPRWRHC